MRIWILAVVLLWSCGAATTDVSNNGLEITTHVSPATGGTITLDPDRDTYTAGDTVHITATPAGGYSFVRFSGGVTSTDTGADVTMSHDLELTATFVGDDVTLSDTVAPVGAGTITVSPSKSSYQVGDVVKLTAKAASGFTSSGWTGDVTASTSTVSMTLSGDTAVQATFTRVAGSAELQIINDLPGTKDGDDDWAQMNTVVHVRVGASAEEIRDAGEGELLTDGMSSCAPGSIGVGTTRTFDVSSSAPDYFVYVQTGAWEYDPFFSGCWDLYLTEVYDCGGTCCTDKSATTQITGHTGGTKTVRLSTLLPPQTWQGSALCQ